MTNPFDLPDNWAWGVLEDFKAPEKYSMTDGPYGSNLKSADYVPSGIRVIRLGNIGVGEFVDKDQAFVSNEKYQSLLKHEAFAGDLVIAALAEPVGRACRVPDHVGQAIVKADCVRMKVAPIFSTDFVMNWLNSPVGRKQTEKRSRGIGRKRINLKNLKAAPAPIPPVNEQRRIVAKIEDLTARSRAAKQALDAIPPLLERFRQSVLAAAFRGDLTKQWRKQNPNTEPATELLKRIRQERRHRWEQDYLEKQKAKGKEPKNDKWKAKYKEPEPVDTTDLPELPVGWCWATPNEICSEIVDCPHSTPKYVETSAFRMVRTSDFSVGQLCLETARIVSEEIYRKRTQRLVPEPGDVLYSREGTIGVACQVPETPKICLGQRMMLLRTGTGYLGELMMWVLSSPIVLGQISKGTIGTTAQRVNVGTVKELAIPLPPFEEQSLILDQIRSAVLAIEQIGSVAALASKRRGVLDQSILAKAFRGELIPQDPTDEPAAALLERIRAEREAAQPKKKPRVK